MMKAKFTPGPWRTSKDVVPEGYIQTTVYEEKTGRRVATAFEAEGNASLIASAPTILDMLLEALPYVEESEQFNKPSCRTLSNRIRSLLLEVDP
jgi:hypothetical protein